MRVLLLEDSLVEATLLSTILREQGHTVRIVATLKEAKAQLETCEALVADLLLPDSGPAETLEWVLFAVTLPTVIISGTTPSDLQMLAVYSSAHVRGFVQKDGLHRVPILLEQEREPDEWVSKAGKLL